MGPNFGSFLNGLLKEHGFTQQGLIEWLLLNQRPVRFRTSNAIKEHLRVARRDNLPAVEYPLLYDIAKFFEVKGRAAAAARIRHIYRQQTYDYGEFASLYSDAPPVAESVAWMVFPQIDRTATLGHRNAWRSQLRNGERGVLRESLGFYYQYANSYVHSPIRQLIAVDLAREAIANSEYTDGYVVAHSYQLAWEQFSRSIKGGRRRMEQASYVPVVEDLFNYLTALQVKATAASYVFYYAPMTASMPLFTKALDALHAQRSVLSPHGAIWDALHIHWHVRFLRALCRSVMSLSPSSLDDREDLAWVRTKMLKGLRRLERQTTEDSRWLGGEHVDHFMVLDTVCRCRALLATTKRQVVDARTVLNGQPKAVLPPGHQNAMTRYRAAATAAICSVSAYRVAAAESGGPEAHAALAEAGEHIRQILVTVPTPRQYHVKQAVRSLASYLQALRIASLEREGAFVERVRLGDGGEALVRVPDRTAGLSIFRSSRDPAALEAELAEYDRKAEKASGIMFVVNVDDAEHIESLIQANALTLRPDRIDLGTMNLGLKQS